MSEKSILSVEQIKKLLEKKGLPTDIENISNIAQFGEGLQLLEEAKYLEALEVFSKLMGQQEHDLIRMYLGVCHFRLGSYENARKHFSYFSTYASGNSWEVAESMLATIEIKCGNFQKAIVILKNLPAKPCNLVNLSLLYWKRYKRTREEFSITEALRILNMIDKDSVECKTLCRVYHLKGLIHQTQKNYFIAQDYFEQALSTAKEEVLTGAILNDYASLWIELGVYEKAEDLLYKAQEKVKGKNEIQEAFNYKWFGLLFLHKKDRERAKDNLEKAVNVLTEKGLIEELIVINFELARSLQNKDFYRAADYYADGITFERLIEEVNDEDEKILSFYSNYFFDGSDLDKSCFS